MSADAPSPVEQLAEAVQEFINATEDHASLVAAAVVVVELVRFDERGQELRRITYTTPGHGASLSGSIGLLDAGLHILRHDALDDDADELDP